MALTVNFCRNGGGEEPKNEFLLFISTFLTDNRYFLIERSERRLKRAGLVSLMTSGQKVCVAAFRTAYISKNCKSRQPKSYECLPGPTFELFINVNHYNNFDLQNPLNNTHCNDNHWTGYTFFLGYVDMKIIVKKVINGTFNLPFVCTLFEPHPQVQAKLGFFSVDIDAPCKFSGFDMCQNVRVKSRRPNGVKDRIVEETRNADLTTLFIILRLVYRQKSFLYNENNYCAISRHFTHVFLFLLIKCQWFSKYGCQFGRLQWGFFILKVIYSPQIF